MTKLGFGWAYLVGAIAGIVWAASARDWPVVVNLALLWVLVIALSVKAQRLGDLLQQVVLHQASQDAAARRNGPLIVMKPQKES